MKRNDWCLVLATAAFSYLFYQEWAGLNFLLFTLLLLGLLVLQTGREVMVQRSWQVTAAAGLLTALNVAVVNTGLAVFANLVSLLLLAVFSRMPAASIFIAALHGLYSAAVSGIRTLQETFRQSANQKPGVLSFAAIGRQHVPMVGVPVLVFLVFLFMYRSSSAAFAHVLSFLNFDFISWPWIFFTLLGGWLMMAFFRPQVLSELAAKDLATPNFLRRVKRPFGHAFKKLGLKHEYKTSFLLLVMLNVLILVFNLSDGYYLALGSLPADVPFSDYLHQGVNTLIVSILMAIGVLLVVFRGNLNFFSGNKALRVLAYVWLAQNLLLVLITLSKNTLYITEFGLTYKRIGVYAYLTLTAIGLVFSYCKIREVRTNWYLFRRNAWAVYVVLVLASCPNWDSLITSYNLTYPPRPDVGYLFSLSPSNLPELYAHSQAGGSRLSATQKSQVFFDREQYLRRKKGLSWLSWSYNHYRIYQALR